MIYSSKSFNPCNCKPESTPDVAFNNFQHPSIENTSNSLPLSSGIGLLDVQAIAFSRAHSVDQLLNLKSKVKLNDANDILTNSQIDLKLFAIDAIESSIIESIKLFQKLVHVDENVKINTVLDIDYTGIIDSFQKLVLQLKSGADSLKNEISKEEKEKSEAHRPKEEKGLTGIVENVMHGISDEADSLESQMKQHTFKSESNSSTSSIETVIKVGGETNSNQHSDKNDTSVHSLEKPVTVLIDSEDNEYTLTKSSDITMHYEDIRLLNDIILLLLCCFAGSYIMQVFKLPSFFGSILAGVILGPSGYIKSLIQVETISRGFGIIFIMFCLGLEFNYPKIQKVWAVSISSTAFMFLFTIAVSVIGGISLGSSERESVVVGACLFLSSTVVALSLLKSTELETQYGRTMMGILVIQDILLGFLLALMPTFVEQSSSNAPFTILKIILSLFIFMFISYLLQKSAVRYILNSLKEKSQSFLAVSLGYCLLLIKIASFFNISPEFACFIAGVMIATEEPHAEATIILVEPLRIVFSSLFFASIGLFIYPNFLWQKGFVLMIMLVGVLTFKIISMWCVMLVSGLKFEHALKVSIGLAQISEFSFILSSRAKNADIVQRETYYALLGLTVLSMVANPLLWYILTCIYPAETEAVNSPKARMQALVNNEEKIN